MFIWYLLSDKLRRKCRRAQECDCCDREVKQEQLQEEAIVPKAQKSAKELTELTTDECKGGFRHVWRSRL